MIKRPVKSKYNWQQFKAVGDRFFYPDITSSSLHASGRGALERRGWKVKMKKEGFGVWVERIV